jgi:hypothetical protein
MANSKEFKTWHKITCAKLLGQPSIEDIVENQMVEGNLKIEYL